MIFSCSMRAVSLYFKNLRYIYALKSSFDFVDFVSYYWNRGNKSSLDKRERLNGISGLPLPQSLRYLRWNWSTRAWGVVFFATISLNFPSYFLLIHSIFQLLILLSLRIVNFLSGALIGLSRFLRVVLRIIYLITKSITTSFFSHLNLVDSYIIKAI